MGIGGYFADIGANQYADAAKTADKTGKNAKKPHFPAGFLPVLYGLFLAKQHVQGNRHNEQAEYDFQNAGIGAFEKQCAGNDAGDNHDT